MTTDELIRMHAFLLRALKSTRDPKEKGLLLIIGMATEVLLAHREDPRNDFKQIADLAHPRLEQYQ